MKKDKNERRIKSPKIFVYGFVKFILNVLSVFLLKVKFERDAEIKKIKGPILSIATHSTIMDVAFNILAMKKRRLNIVCGRDVLSWRWLNIFRKGLRIIPISQFGFDLLSIKDIKRAVSNDCSIALFPEGKISLDGRNLHYCVPATAKLIKLLNVPVVFSHAYGGYAVRPKWFHSFRRGQVIYKSEVLFTQEDIKKLSVSQMHDILCAKFIYNDNLYRIENKKVYKSKKPAEGLQYILYKCPSCGAEYEMATKIDEIFCNKCGYKVKYDLYGRLVPIGEEGVSLYERIDQWYDFQKEAIQQEIAEENFEISKDVDWISMNNDTYEYGKMGEGVLYINFDEIGFRGRDTIGNKINMHVPTEHLFTIVQKTNEGIDLTIENIIHRFYFKEKKYSTKYTLIIEEIFKAKNSKK